jgi:hypothetical protein
MKQNIFITIRVDNYHDIFVLGVAYNVAEDNFKDLQYFACFVKRFDSQKAKTRRITQGSRYPYCIIRTSRPCYRYKRGLVIRIYERALLSVQIKLYG